VSIDDKRWNGIRGITLSHEDAVQGPLPQFDAMPAFRSKPAAVEAFGRNNDVVIFAGREVEILLDTFFGEAADDAG